MIDGPEVTIDVPPDSPAVEVAPDVQIDTLADSLKAAVADSEGISPRGVVFKPAGGKSVSAGARIREAPIELMYSGEELQPLVEALGNSACKATGTANLTSTEITEISTALAPVLTKYTSESLRRFGAEVALAGVLLKVGLPRYAVWSKAKKEATEIEPPT